MFLLTTRTDSLTLAASKFAAKRLPLIERYIERKYCNQVIPNIGLCVATHDILSIGDEKIPASATYSIIKVTFRLLVFKPFVNEIIDGVISKSTENGIFITLGFFENIFIPKHLLFSGAFWNESTQQFKANFSDQLLEYETNSIVRFRVSQVLFSASAPQVVYSKSPSSTKLESPNSDSKPIQTILDPVEFYSCQKMIDTNTLKFEESDVAKPSTPLTKRKIVPSTASGDPSSVQSNSSLKDDFEKEPSNLQKIEILSSLPYKTRMKRNQGFRSSRSSFLGLGHHERNVEGIAHHKLHPTSSQKEVPSLDLLITGSMATVGLGPRVWWRVDDESSGDENSSSNEDDDDDDDEVEKLNNSDHDSDNESNDHDDNF